MDKRAAQREAQDSAAAEQEFRDLVEDTIAEMLPQMIVNCLTDPMVIRTLRTVVGGSKTSPVPPPLRAAQVKRLR